MSTSVAKHPPLRSLRDRIRQVALFEIFGLLLIAPPFSWLSGQPMGHSMGLLAILALIAALWNAAYGTLFDWLEGRLTGRTADRRPFLLRVFHACTFEGGIVLLSWPVLVWGTGLDWIPALYADLGLSVVYVLYALAFNWLYDRCFPILPHGA